jgi:hypothetical protein
MSCHATPLFSHDNERDDLSERQDHDLDAELGAVVAGADIEGIVELKGRINLTQVHEFSLKVRELN